MKYIDLYINSSVKSIMVTEDAQHEEELMTSDSVQLSWKDVVKETLPAGAYIIYKGEKYTLTDDYQPKQEDEITYSYTPKFDASHIRWKKVPFFFYTYDESGQITNRETDWQLTDTPANFMAKVIESIKNETGEIYTYAVAQDLPASVTVSFQAMDIFSGLNSIAEACETEWWRDKKNKVLHLSRAAHGEERVLEVGVNINVPSVSSSSEENGYYNRFYAYGGTTNIPQEYQGAGANNLINKRLTLSPDKYPAGYKDTVENLQDKDALSKILLFDDIYPKSLTTIAEVRARLKYVLDSETGQKIQIGTDDQGNPIYDQYTIWYFRIPGYNFNKEDIIEGKNLSVKFMSGSLNGREFELAYYNIPVIKNDVADVIPFQIKAGDFEILYVKEGDYIIPASVGLVPVDGDTISLLNVKLPQSAYDKAYTDLEEALDKKIASMSEDLNSYTSSRIPQSYTEGEEDFTIGQNVLYKNGDYSFSTRITKIVCKLDFEFEQTLTFGNELVKGSTQELKEDVFNASQNIDILKELNALAQKTIEAYQRTQQAMLDGLAKIANMWMLSTDYDNAIRTPYDVEALNIIEQIVTPQIAVTKKFYPPSESGDYDLYIDNTSAVSGEVPAAGSINMNAVWEALADTGVEQINISHLAEALENFLRKEDLIWDTWDD